MVNAVLPFSVLFLSYAKRYEVVCELVEDFISRGLNFSSFKYQDWLRTSLNSSQLNPFQHLLHPSTTQNNYNSTHRNRLQDVVSIRKGFVSLFLCTALMIEIERQLLEGRGKDRDWERCLSNRKLIDNSITGHKVPISTQETAPGKQHAMPGKDPVNDQLPADDGGYQPCTHPQS